MGSWPRFRAPLFRAPLQGPASGPLGPGARARQRRAWMVDRVELLFDVGTSRGGRIELNGYGPPHNVN